MVEEGEMIPVVILCGGSGTRLREQTEFIPKSMIPIGGKPMIWHIMKIYDHYGFKDFILALGYKQEAFKQYFSHFYQINNDIVVKTGLYEGMTFGEDPSDNWTVRLVDTGENTLKGARLKRVEKYITEDAFMCTYGDGVGNIDIPTLLAFHRSHGKLVTITGVHPVPRFGELCHEEGKVLSYREKPDDGCLINGGFMVMNRGIFDYLTTGEWCDLEIGPLELIAAKGELMVYHHKGYWSCMDSLSDLGKLQQAWTMGKAPWRIW
jgi:glucose-1-phosphate cytidylyltransferase